MNFNELGINEEILRSIKFEKPTQIQEKTIPLVLEGKDVIAQSETGSGKTFAFGVGVVQKSEKGKGLQALIITPTRELAEQVTNEMSKFSKHKQLRTTAVYGGVSINPQITNLRNAEIAVGTPGRLLDHLERGTINLSKIKILVLDEADRMLDMGFIKDVKNILKACPSTRQTLLFSATMDKEIVELASRNMNNPQKITAGTKVNPKLLKQVFYDISDSHKLSLLVHMLKSEKAGLIMVFCNTQRNTEFVAKNLRKQDIHAAAIHGGLSQAKRTQTITDFQNKGDGILVCTDVAARGLHINDVSHVYNYDLPMHSKEYTHRIGRTARAGGAGIAINLVSKKDHENFSSVLRHTSYDIQRLEAPTF